MPVGLHNQGVEEDVTKELQFFPSICIGFVLHEFGSWTELRLEQEATLQKSESPLDCKIKEMKMMLHQAVIFPCKDGKYAAKLPLLTHLLRQTG